MKINKLKIIIIISIIVIILILFFIFQFYHKSNFISKAENSNTKAEIVLFYEGGDSELVLVDHNNKDNNYQVSNRITLNDVSDFGPSYHTPIRYNKKHNFIVTKFYKHRCNRDGIIMTDLNTLKSKRLEIEKATQGCSTIDVNTDGDYVVASGQNSVTLFDIKDNTQKDYPFPKEEILSAINQDDKVFLFGYYDKEIKDDFKVVHEIKMISNNKIKNVAEKSIAADSYRFYKGNLYGISDIQNDNGDVIEQFITIINNNGKVIKNIKIPFYVSRLAIADDKVYLTKSDSNGNNASIIIYDLRTEKFESTPIKIKDKTIWSLQVKNDKIYAYAHKYLGSAEEERIDSGYFEGLVKGYIYVYDAKTYELLNTIDVNTKEYNPNAYMFSSFTVIDQK